MRKIAVMLCCIGAASLVSVSLEAGMFDSVMPAKLGSGSLSKNEINVFFELSKQADLLMNKSLNNVSKMLLNKDELERIERQKKEIEGIKDPKEKEAAINKVVEDQSATVEKAIEDKDANDKMDKLDENQKKLASDSIYNLFLSGLKNKSSFDKATVIVQKAQANPIAAASYVSELPRIKDAVVILPAKAEKTISLSNKLVKLAKTAKIEVTLPTTSTDQPKTVADF